MDLNVFEAMPGVGILVKTDSVDYTVITITDDAGEFFQRERDTVTGKPYMELTKEIYSPAARDKIVTSFQMAVTSGSLQEQLIVNDSLTDSKNANQKQKWLIKNKPVFNAKGQLTYIIQSIITQVSESTDAPRKMNDDLEKANYLFTQAPVAVCLVTGPDYIVELVNDRMLTFLGRTSSIIGSPIEQTLTEAKIQGLTSILDKVRQTGEPYYVANFPAVILIEGVRELRYFDLVFKPYFPNPDKKEMGGIFCVAHNVTEQALVRKKIEEEQQRTSLALSVGELGVVEIDWESKATVADKRCNDIFGFENSKTWDDYLAMMHPDDRPIREKAIEEGIDTGVFNYEVRLLHTDHSTSWIRCKGIIYRDEEGKPKKTFGIVQDITEHKNFADALQAKVEERTHELANANENLVRLNMELARSNDNLEEFAYAASHDLKEPIRKINFFSDHLRRELAPSLSEQHYRLFERMEYATKRMGALIDDLLLYSHVSTGDEHLEEIDLNQKLALVLEDLELEIEDKKALVTRDKLPTIKGHRRQLQQLFQNLIGNALKYSKPGIAPEIRIVCRVIKNEDVIDFAGKDPNKNYYLIEVNDNGIGFESQDANRIFNMFTRLHGNAEYKGTGIGLSIVKKVAENHQGHIWAEGHLGEGASFKLLLPDNHSEASQEKQQPESKP